MKKFICITAACALILSLASCGSLTPSEASGQPSDRPGDKPVIVCTSFASYDWIRNILGEEQENWQLIRLNENGSDMHSYQPSVKDVAAISSCDLLVYTGGLSEEWVTEAASSENGFVGLSLSLMEACESGHLIESGHEHEHRGQVCSLDEHIWLSPANAFELCDDIAEKIIAIDPDNRVQYESNACRYREKLKELDENYRRTLSQCKENTLIFADRFPFYYLTEDYGLQYYAAFPGCSAETEAGFDAVISLAEKLKAMSSPALLITERSDDSVAKAVINASGLADVKIYELNSLQSVTRDDIKEGLTYTGALEQNLKILKEVLD